MQIPVTHQNSLRLLKTSHHSHGHGHIYIKVRFQIKVLKPEARLTRDGSSSYPYHIWTSNRYALNKPIELFGFNRFLCFQNCITNLVFRWVTSIKLCMVLITVGFHHVPYRIYWIKVWRIGWPDYPI